LQGFYLDIVFICNGFKVFLKCFCKCFNHIFQVFYLSLLYVASVTSTYFKIRSDIAHGMRVGRGGHEWSPHKRVVWAKFDGAAPAWPRDAGVGKQRLAIVSP
jgi:hypothetical protein